MGSGAYCGPGNHVAILPKLLILVEVLVIDFGRSREFIGMFGILKRDKFEPTNAAIIFQISAYSCKFYGQKRVRK